MYVCMYSYLIHLNLLFNHVAYINFGLDSHYVFGLYPPQLIFDITVTIEQVNSTSRNNTWSPVVENLKIGPQRTIMKSANYSVCLSCD